MVGPMTNIVQLTRGQKRWTKNLLIGGGVPKDPDHHHAQEEEGRMTPMLLPFVRPDLLHTPTFCWMLRKVFSIASFLFGWGWFCWCWWFGCYCCCCFCCCCFCSCCCCFSCCLVFGKGFFFSLCELLGSTLCWDGSQAPDLACMVRLLLLLLWVWSFEGRISPNDLSACRPNRGATCPQQPPSYFDPYKQWYERWPGSSPYLGTYLLCSHRVLSQLPILLAKLGSRMSHVVKLHLQKYWCGMPAIFKSSCQMYAVNVFLLMSWSWLTFELSLTIS